MAAGNGTDLSVAKVQHAMGESPLADCFDSCWNRRSSFRTSVRVLFAECLPHCPLPMKKAAP